MSLFGASSRRDEDSDERPAPSRKKTTQGPSMFRRGLNFISGLSAFLPPLRKPSVHPLSASLWVGAITAFAVASNPWVSLLSWAATAAVGTFAYFKVRDFAYNRRVDRAQNDSEFNADELGRKAGKGTLKGHLNYARSFFSLDAYRHPLRFGVNMRREMRSAPLSTGYDGASSRQRFGNR